MINIVILSTPFHLHQFLGLMKELCVEEADNHIIHSELINSKNVTKSLQGKLSTYAYNTTDLQLSLTATSKRIIALFLRPMESLSAYRKTVSNGKAFIGDLLMRISNQEDRINLVIFNDRDLLSQISILAVKNTGKPYKIIAVDEGTGFYIREGLNHRLKKIMYRYFAKYILGFNYIFMEQYGTHKDISRVYIRYPNLLPNRKCNIDYVKIEEDKSIASHKIDLGRPAILVFSTLLSEEGFLSEPEELSFFKSIATYLAKHGYGLVIKHHPREKDLKLDQIRLMLSQIESLKFETVGVEIHGEELDTTSFEWIVNFGSSVILTLLGSGVPPSKIITLRLRNVAFAKQIFSKTRVVSLSKFVSKVNKIMPLKEGYL